MRPLPEWCGTIGLFYVIIFCDVLFLLIMFDTGSMLVFVFDLSSEACRILG